MTTNFMSSKDSNETWAMHTKSNNIEIMIGNETDEIIRELFQSLLQKNQDELKESMRGSEFVFDSIDLLYYKLHKITSTINPNNNDDKCFQYAVAVALNYQKINKNPERISKIKPFIDQYNWKERNFPSHKKEWKKFESNNKLIALNILNILHVPYDTEKMRRAYKSQHNNKSRENQVILLMILMVKHGIVLL